MKGGYFSILRLKPSEGALGGRSSLRGLPQRDVLPAVNEAQLPRLRHRHEGAEPTPEHLFSPCAQGGIANFGRQANTFGHRTAFLLHPFHSWAAPSDVSVECALRRRS